VGLSSDDIKPSPKATIRSLRRIFQHFGKIIDIYTERLARSILGPIANRVASFGYYTLKGKNEIEEVAKMISQLGKVGVTMDAYYLPNDSAGRPMGEIIPPFIRYVLSLWERGEMMIEVLPKIVSKAVFNFTILRTQLIEWYLCNENNVSCLCFIICNKIKGEKKNCPYLSISSSSSYSECIAPNSFLCTGYSGKVFCPFTKSKQIPWVIIQATIRERPRSRLIAVKQLSDLKEPLQSFLYS
jgi:hypothetical protein